jgi:choline dehydrogenase-like flavoprotein
MSLSKSSLQKFPLRESYDFVIVGAGTAGCLWANFLTKKYKVSVLVLEAGLNYDTDPLILNMGGQGTQVTPFPTKDRIGTVNDIGTGAAVQLLLSSSLASKYYWSHYTIPMSGVNNRVFLYGMGRVAGGTSAVNGGLWIRPSPQALDRWVALTGDQEYSMNNMIPRWVKVETYIGSTNVPQVHGTKGRIKNR